MRLVDWLRNCVIDLLIRFIRAVYIEEAHAVHSCILPQDRLPRKELGKELDEKAKQAAEECYRKCKEIEQELIRESNTVDAEQNTKEHMENIRQLIEKRKELKANSTVRIDILPPPSYEEKLLVMMELRKPTLIRLLEKCRR